MYRKLQNTREPGEAFELPFEGKLCEENRWVLLSNREHVTFVVSNYTQAAFR